MLGDLLLVIIFTVFIYPPEVFSKEKRGRCGGRSEIPGSEITVGGSQK